MGTSNMPEQDPQAVTGGSGVVSVGKVSSGWLKFSSPVGYGAAALAIFLAWSLRDQNLIRAEDGIGYWLGVVGGCLMLLLLVYPIRQRLQSLSGIGSIRFWFQTHMIFGVLGPLFVLFHSNFNLGSLNGRVALFCTLVVAGSGLLGRYLYAKIHHGMYGRRASLESLRNQSILGNSDSGRLGVIELINERLLPYEEVVLARSRRILPSVIGIALAPLTSRLLEWSLARDVRAAVDDQARGSDIIAEHRSRLHASAKRYLASRLASYRKFAQLKGCERLFSLWHVVHFPLFLVMVVAAGLHVVAVHAY